VLLALVLCLLGSAAHADEQSRAFYTGNDLWETCNREDKAASGFCQGYAAAIVDSLSSVAQLNGTCFADVPDPVSVDQVKDVIIKRLRDFPESRHYTAFSIATAAIQAVWPCPK
jgi:hypothetical protein